MSITDELRECPFCGGEADYHIHERAGVECIECGGGFAAVYATKHEAAAAWNRRAAIEATVPVGYGGILDGYILDAELMRRLEEADYVKVVRCKNCLFFNTDGYYGCELLDFARPSMEDGFCAWGERRDA